MKVRSQFIPATQGVTERTEKQRKLIMYDKSGKEMFPRIKVVPNKALKVKDIIDRFTRGLPIDEGQTSKPIWPEGTSHDSPDYNKLNMMDRPDRADMARTIRKRVPKEPDKSPDAIANPDIKPKTE